MFNGKTCAQTYFPKGAIWYYHSPSFTSASFSYTTIESKGDSIFNGDTLTYMEGYVGCGAGIDELVKQVGQKVYKLNKCDSSYSLLYDFGANVGDTIITFPDICFDTHPAKIKIDSIKPININGNILNQYYFTDLTFYPGWVVSSSGPGSTGSIIEGIGNTDSFYPYLGACDPFGGPLRCYEDTVIGYYNSGLFASCDTVYVGIDEHYINDNIKIFPNPTTAKIEITSTEKVLIIKLFDIRGIELLVTNKQVIDLSSLPEGIYLVKVDFTDGASVYRKILKE